MPLLAATHVSRHPRRRIHADDHGGTARRGLARAGAAPRCERRPDERGCEKYRDDHESGYHWITELVGGHKDLTVSALCSRCCILEFES